MDMKEIWLLTKMAFGSVLPTNRMFRKKKENRRTFLVLFLALCGIGILALSTLYSVSIGMALNMMGGLEMLPTVYMAVMALVTLFTTIYKVKGTLFGFGDYDALMSLPVATWKIVASRLTLLYLINLLFTAAILLPANIVYGVMADVGAVYYLTAVVLLLFVPAVPMVIGTVIGILISVAAARFRHSNLVQMLLLFALILGSFWLSFAMMGSGEDQMNQAITGMTDMVNGIYPPAAIYGNALCGGSLMSAALFAGISLAAYFLFAAATGVLFKKLNTGIMTVRTRADFKFQTEQADGTPFLALYKKEFRRFFSSALYVFNAGFGIVMITVGAVLCLFIKPEQLIASMELPGVSENLAIMVAGVVTVFAATISTTCSSISLEGKHLWILRCAPVSTEMILKAKLAVNLTVSVPLLAVDGLLFCIILKPEPVGALFLFLLPISYAFFAANFGLLANLKFPVLDWKSETVVIKQSAASMCGILGGMVLGAVPIGLVIGFPAVDPYLIFAAAAAIVLLAAFAIWWYLKTKGTKLFEALS